MHESLYQSFPHQLWASWARIASMNEIRNRALTACRTPPIRAGWKASPQSPGSLAAIHSHGSEDSIRAMVIDIITLIKGRGEILLTIQRVGCFSSQGPSKKKGKPTVGTRAGTVRKACDSKNAGAEMNTVPSPIGKLAIEADGAGRRRVLWHSRRNGH